MIVPADASTKELKAHFETVIKDASDFMIAVSISPFKIKGIKNFVFSAKDVTWDQSDFNNPTGFSFPSTYSNAVYSSNPTLWRGLYFRNVSVQLPSYLNGDSKEPITVAGENLIFDDEGFSGSVSASSILSLEKGKIAKGFNLSISKLSLSFASNELKKGEMSGYIKLPISEDDTLGYSAMADAAGQFNFTASVSDTLDVDLWKGKTFLYPSSSLTINENDGDVTIKALLNGKMVFGPSISSSSSKAIKLTANFEELLVSNKSPYFSVKAFGVDSLGATNNIAGFEFTLNSISFSCQEDRASIGVDLMLGIGGSGGKSFSAGGDFAINAKRSDSRWKFNGVRINEFSIGLEFSGLKLNGRLNIYSDSPQYGDGISGSIKMSLTKLNIEAGASAIFGKVNGYKYWYADAFSSLNMPIATGVNLVALGGGAYTKMRQGAPEDKEQAYGYGSSGICYVPDDNISFGFMAKVGIATTDGKIVNGDAALEMAFNKHGGISYISFLGHAKIIALKSIKAVDAIKKSAGKLAETMDKINNATGSAADKAKLSSVIDKGDVSPLKERAESIAESMKKEGGGAPIEVTLLALFDFDNHSFFSKMEATVNVAGVIRGVNPGNSAGEMVMYFGPDEWYIHCGTPTTPIGLELLGFAKLKSYFMMGHNMPAFPEPPAKVSSIIGISYDRSRDIVSLEGGKGIAFGASFEMDTGDLQFLMFYARFAAGLGFDVMLKDYGNSSCAGSDDKIGINGWYASGQSWAYVSGDVGIRVKMRFIRGKFTILQLSVGTILEAQLPNPSWFHGAVGGSYRILGGLVKGRCKFEFELGKKCKIKSNAKDLLADINVISDIKPSDGGSDVSVFTKPQAVFSMPINKAFEIDAPDGYKYRFRAKLDRFVALDGNNPIDATLEYNEDSTVLTINPYCTLPQKKSLTASAELSFEEFKNGKWEAVKDESTPVTEKKAITFETGTAPNYIPEDNVVYEYPVKDQRNFYKNIHNKGFVVLDMWQDYLFANKEFVPYAQFRVGDKVVAKTAITTDYKTKQVKFDLPQSAMALNTNYELRLVNESKLKNADTQQNIVSKEQQVSSSDSEAGEITLTTKEATKELVIAEDKEIYSIKFKTSSYSTLDEKISACKTKVYQSLITPLVYSPKVYLEESEGFDVCEKVGSEFTANKALVCFEMLSSNIPWYRDIVFPNVYKNYPFLGIGKINRSLNPYGLIPNTAVHLDAGQKNHVLFYTPVYMRNDFIDVRNNIAALFTQRTSLSIEETARLSFLLNEDLPTFTSVKGVPVSFKINYRLPNGTIVYSRELQFKYAL